MDAWNLPKRLVERKSLSIKCGNGTCTPSVYDNFCDYIIVYRHNKWWFRIEYPLLGGITDYDAKQIKEMAQADYDMYCKRNEVSNI